MFVFFLGISSDSIVGPLLQSFKRFFEHLVLSVFFLLFFVSWRVFLVINVIWVRCVWDSGHYLTTFLRGILTQNCCILSLLLTVENFFIMVILIIAFILNYLVLLPFCLSLNNILTIGVVESIRLGWFVRGWLLGITISIIWRSLCHVPVIRCIKVTILLFVEFNAFAFLALVVIVWVFKIHHLGLKLQSIFLLFICLLFLFILQFSLFFFMIQCHINWKFLTRILILFGLWDYLPSWTWNLLEAVNLRRIFEQLRFDLTIVSLNLIDFLLHFDILDLFLILNHSLIIELLLFLQISEELLWVILCRVNLASLVFLFFVFFHLFIIA